jgi:hypothetical protein
MAENGDEASLDFTIKMRRPNGKRLKETRKEDRSIRTHRGILFGLKG